MRTAFFSTHGFEREPFAEAGARAGVEFAFFEEKLTARTAPLAAGFGAVCLFVNDAPDAPALEALVKGGTRLLALRSAGFNHVDLACAERLGVTVARVPAYSPYAVAEHAAALVLALNRKIHRAVARTREHNFEIDGLMGFDLHGKTAGVVGTGRIGAAFCRIMLGFGCRVLAHDPYPSAELEALGVRYVGLDELWRESDVASLHCPLTPATRHVVDARALSMMKRGAMLVNTGRGALVDARAALEALKDGRLGSLGLDVYEEEGDLFFRDLSGEVMRDDVLALLLTMPNVIVTAHQGFFTREAVGNIADTTCANVAGYARGGAAGVPAENVVLAQKHVAR